MKKVIEQLRQKTVKELEKEVKIQRFCRVLALQAKDAQG